MVRAEGVTSRTPTMRGASGRVWLVVKYEIGLMYVRPALLVISVSAYTAYCVNGLRPMSGAEPNECTPSVERHTSFPHASRSLHTHRHMFRVLCSSNFYFIHFTSRL